MAGLSAFRCGGTELALWQKCLGKSCLHLPFCTKLGIHTATSNLKIFALGLRSRATLNLLWSTSVCLRSCPIPVSKIVKILSSAATLCSRQLNNWKSTSPACSATYSVWSAFATISLRMDCRGLTMLTWGWRRIRTSTCTSWKRSKRSDLNTMRNSRISSEMLFNPLERCLPTSLILWISKLWRAQSRSTTTRSSIWFPKSSATTSASSSSLMKTS